MAIRSLTYLSVAIVTAGSTSAGLLIYYDFDTINATTVGNAGTHAADGTLAGTAAGAGGYVTSMTGFGTAYDFTNGDDDSNYVDTGVSPNGLGITGGDYTMSAWIKFDTGAGADLDNMVFGAVTDGNSGQLHNGFRDEKAHQGHWGADTTDDVIQPLGSWHHVAYRYEGNGGVQTIFINGAEAASGTSKNSVSGADFNLSVGWTGRDSNDAFDGTIDDAGIFDEALNDLQTRAIYILGTAPYHHDLGEVLQILDAHTTGPGGSVTLGSGTWRHTAINPGGGADFVPLADDGSGVERTTGPPITAFGAAPAFIESGGSSILSWEVIPPFTSITISPEPGDVTSPETDAGGTGMVAVSPTETTTYTISVTGAGGTSQRTTTVFVDIDPSTPRISEFVADNTGSGHSDEDGDTEDWIELHAPGLVPADVSTYYLTDDATDLTKWAFPEISIPANSYLIVFASGKDRAVAGAEQHTNFKLSGGGEYLALTRDDGMGGVEIVSEFNPAYPPQEEGASYGLGEDGVSFGYFGTPTPGAANGTSFAGFVADTVFGTRRGFFTAPFELTITSATEGAEIRYTTDGSEPTATSGQVYAGPISISTTTVLRAAAFKSGYEPTNVDTNTYIYPADVVAQPKMRTSITQSPTYGPQMINSLNAVPTISLATGHTAFENEGGGNIRSEHQTSIEMIFPDGTPGFQEDAGLSNFGGRYTNFRKKSFRVAFRSEFGKTKLKYPIFDGFRYDNFQPAEEFDVINLRSGSHDMQSRGAYMSNRFTDDSMMAMGNVAPHGRFVHVYLNGKYWGQYHLRERWSADMASGYFGGSEEDYDAVNANDNFVNDLEVYDGDGAFWNETTALVAGAAPFTNAAGHIDIANIVDFMLLWVSGNSESEFRAFGSAAQGVPFKFMIKDADGFLRGTSSGKVSHAGPLGIMSRMHSGAGGDDFDMLVADRIHKHFFNDGALTPANNIGRLQKRVDEAQPGFISEAARWGDQYRDPDSWESYQDNLLNNHFPGLTDTMIGRFRSAGMYPDIIAPVFNRHGGSVSPDTPVTMATDADTIYYTLDGSDPRLPGGTPDPDALVATFDGGGGGPPAATYLSNGHVWKYLDDGSDQGTAWRGPAFDDSGWQSGPSELGYGTDGEGSGTTVGYGPDASNKFPTTYFRTTVDIPDPSAHAGFLLRVKYDDGIAIFINGTWEIRQNLALAAASSVFANGNVSDENGWKEFALPSSALVAGTNTIAAEVHQAGGGSSDIRLDMDLRGDAGQGGGDNVSDPLFFSDTTVLRARAYNSGSGEWSALNEAPFTIDTVPADSTNLVVSELHYHPANPTAPEEIAASTNPDSFEFIELLNIGGSSLDLTGVRFDAGIEFAFPAQTVLPAGERLLLLSERVAFDARYGAPAGVQSFEYSGQLANDGEALAIIGSAPQPLRDFTYSDQAPWPTTADGAGPSLVLVNPSEAPPHGEPASWSASRDPGGSPGSAEPTTLTYARWAAIHGIPGGADDDDDRDLISNYFEFLFGSRPDLASDAPAPTAAIQSVDVGGAVDDYLTLTFRQNLLADGASLAVEISSDLATWSDDPSLTESISSIDNGDGTATVTIRLAAPVSSGEGHLYIRLRGNDE